MAEIRRFDLRNKQINKIFVLFLIGVGFCLISAGSCFAQMFGNEADQGQDVPLIATSPSRQINRGRQENKTQETRSSHKTGIDNVRRPSAPQAGSSGSPTPATAQHAPTGQNDVSEQTPQVEPQAAYQFRFVGDEVFVDTKPKIFLYYRDFKISRNINGSINCTMRFYVLSTMKEKISNISYRLKWPEMETALSFDDVEPNIANYFDYSLLGKGCYSMDKAPNIIVNRCRVKGMSQKQCADTIQWLN